MWDAVMAHLQLPSGYDFSVDACVLLGFNISYVGR